MRAPSDVVLLDTPVAGACRPTPAALMHSSINVSAFPLKRRGAAQVFANLIDGQTIATWR